MIKEINEYVAYDKYKYEFYFSVFVLIFMNIFYYFKPQFTFETSIKISVYLRSTENPVIK